MKKVIAESLARVHTLCLLNKKEEQNDIIYKYKKIVMKV